MSETIYGRLITKAFTGAATIPPSADHSNGDWISTDIYEHELYIDDATGKLYTNINGVITQLNPTDTNLANTDLTQTAATNRTYDINGNLLKFHNGQFQVDGSMGINIVPDSIVPAWITIESADTKRPLYVNSTGSANAATFGANTGRAVIGSGSGDIAVYGLNNAGGDGLRGTSTAGVGVRGQSPTHAGYFEGDVYVETNGLTGTPDASAVFEVNSTTKGALIPRMTTVQRNAIPSPATGLMVYDLDTDRYEFYNGSYWQGTETRFINIQHGSYASPAGGAIVHFGGMPIAPQLAGSLQPAFNFTMRGNGVIRGCDFTSFAGGTAGTSEAWEVYIFVNNTTSYLVASVSSVGPIRNFNNSSLNIPYVDGDLVRLYYKNPASWSTPPTGVVGQGTLTLQ